MNLQLLFKEQQLLRDKIAYNGPDRFEKLVLALLVELGECANEWRGFKFWSKDQEPRIEVLIPCDSCEGSGRSYSGYCGSCHGGYVGKENPLLEEYVDGLHFVLEIGLEHQFDADIIGLEIAPLKWESITEQFTCLFKADWHIYACGDAGYYHEGLELFLGLGEMLGFTWEQIEQAYFEKNAVNHQRQEDGY